MLSGTVEFDVFYFGKTKKVSKRGRETVLMGLSKDEEGNPMFAKMQVVPNLKGKTIAKFAKSSIAEGSAVQSDAYRSYRKPLTEKLPARVLGFRG